MRIRFYSPLWQAIGQEVLRLVLQRVQEMKTGIPPSLSKGGVNEEAKNDELCILFAS